jgi:hypothetical protein
MFLKTTAIIVVSWIVVALIRRIQPSKHDRSFKAQADAPVSSGAPGGDRRNSLGARYRHQQRNPALMARLRGRRPSRSLGDPTHGDSPSSNSWFLARSNPIIFYGGTVILSSVVVILLGALEPFSLLLPLKTGGHIIDGSAYDMLFGTIAGGLSVAFSAYFAIITTLLILIHDRGESRLPLINSQFYTSGYLFIPFVLLELSMLLLGAHAFRGTLYHWALPAFLLLGAATAINFARLAAVIGRFFGAQAADLWR